MKTVSSSLARCIALISLTFVLVVLAASNTSAATRAYVRSEAAGPPWGENTNETAMDGVFGAGNWDDLRYETVNPNTLFSNAYHFVFLEGGDDDTPALVTFLTNNQTLIMNWVDAGGRLFVNAAPNSGPSSFSCGFGVTNTRENFSEVATAADSSHPIFNGPFTPVGTTWTGDAFAHAILTGGGTTPLINGGAPGVVLAELHPGAGLALFGGMTTTNFHEPQPQATNLRWNILYYAAFTALCDTDPPVITVPANTIDLIAQKKKVNGQFGAFAFFNVSAFDPEDGPVAATANPPSGSFFPVGTTVVTVTATDSCGNTSTSQFGVTVAIKRKRHAPF